MLGLVGAVADGEARASRSDDGGTQHSITLHADSEGH
jgi:hypothetical protein